MTAITGTKTVLDLSAVSWVELAACRHRDTAFWFSTPASLETRVALAVCRSCPVRAECLAEALMVERFVDGPRFGIFGGMLPGERASLADVRAGSMMGSCVSR